MQLASAQANDAAKQAGEEYTTWAGLDVLDYRAMAGHATTGRADRLPRRRRAHVQPALHPAWRLLPLHAARAVHRPSTTAPRTQTCFTPCPGVLGCAMPTPDVRRVREVGPGRRDVRQTLTNPQFALQATAIASAGICLRSHGRRRRGSPPLLGEWRRRRSPRPSPARRSPRSIWPFADAPGIAAAAGAAVIAVCGPIVILAIIIAVMEGIRVTENAALPGKVAELVVERAHDRHRPGDPDRHDRRCA